MNGAIQNILLITLIVSSCKPAVKQEETTAAVLVVDTNAVESAPVKVEEVDSEEVYQRPFDPGEVLVKEYGVVRVADNEKWDAPPNKISIYNEDGTKYKTFIDGDWTTVEDIHPYFSKMDYGELIFICVGISEKGFAVIVDEKEQTVKYIRKNEKGMIYEPWADHLLTTTGINFNQEENPLRKSPDEQANTISINTNNNTGFKALLVKGDWLLVRVEDMSSDEGADENALEGWVRWRDEKGYLLLELYYLC